MGLADDRRLLSTSHAWSATPADYSSLRFLMLRPDGTGEMVSGYGQTIHAHILCRWELLPANRLAVTYLESPAKRAGAFFQGYFPPADRPPRVLECRLTEGPVTVRPDRPSVRVPLDARVRSSAMARGRSAPSRPAASLLRTYRGAGKATGFLSALLAGFSGDLRFL